MTTTRNKFVAHLLEHGLGVETAARVARDEDSNCDNVDHGAKDLDRQQHAALLVDQQVVLEAEVEFIYTFPRSRVLTAPDAAAELDDLTLGYAAATCARRKILG